MLCMERIWIDAKFSLLLHWFFDVLPPFILFTYVNK